MDAQTNQDQHPATDDQALAQVLAGVEEQASQLTTPGAEADSPSGLHFEETPITSTAPTETVIKGQAETPAVEEPTLTKAPDTAPVVATVTASTTSSQLENIKKDALEELRPLVTKLDLPADEKFDTMLLIIRSTDDQSLLGAAHDAAKNITDEKKRAEALLDIIKEIDYFANQHAA